MSYVILRITGRTFREMDVFLKQVESYGDPELLKNIQNEILNNFDIGDTVSGTGGLRKFRMPDPTRGKGKRGGLRVLYLDLPNRGITYLFYLYGKGEAHDVSPQQKKALKALVDQIKREE